MSRVLPEILRLDPVRDNERIVFLSTRFDFPWDTTRALEFALFRTFCVPSISALLDRTGEFGQRAQKRYDDTDIIVSELIEHGYTGDRGKRALRRMNQIHGRFEISNEDFLYVLSTFIYEPIRWNERFGWRPLCEVERLGYFHFWREVGRRMNIREIPGDYGEFERFNRDYERQHYRYTDSNRRVGEATRELFVSWFPGMFAPVVRRVIHAMLDEPLRKAFGFPTPYPWECSLVERAMRLRGWLLRFLPHRSRAHSRTSMPRPTYPNGYELEELGPPAMR
ncbi:MAG: oxygenase MpaB family protein [Candidatus Eremiobacterota bacterium]